MGEAKPRRREGLQQRLVAIITETTHFPGAGHLDTQDGVGADKSREAELRRLYRHVIEVEHAPLDGLADAQHPAHGLAHEVNAGHLGHERQRARGPQIALDDPYPAVLDEQLKVERPRDGQRLGQLGGNFLGAMDDGQWHGLGRKHQGRITAVHAGILHVLADRP